MLGFATLTANLQKWSSSLDMKLQFHGACRTVTGSCFLVESQGFRLLVDCGLIQGSKKEELRNREDFPFDPSLIDAVILTHAHLDHSGRLPLLCKKGFNGTIYTHAASRDLCRIMLMDAAYISQKEADWENRKRERKHLPLIDALYNDQDVESCLEQFKALDYNETFHLNTAIRFKLNDAGHILGSSILELFVNEHGIEKKVVFSGDLGHHGAPILEDPSVISHADLVVMESTYGNRLHRSWDSTWEELKDVFTSASQRHSNILIPSFAVGRAQELLYLFTKHFDDWQLNNWKVFLDSPMAIAATQVYAKHRRLFDREAQTLEARQGDPLQLPNLYKTRTATQSIAINRFESGAIVIAGSGMCNGGRIKHHLKHNIWRNNTHVLIIGFQAGGTIGRQLVDGAKSIRLWGETIRIGATIHTIGGLSAHADQQGLIDWYQHFQSRPHVVLVHGESEGMDTLAEKLSQTGAQKVDCPRLGDVIDI